ncbi:MAG: hypothetical protein IPP48_14895 [Chitinophagaceae bacterium]|nr:hypothetical protein [Chitinophagaceae bacterium]
MKFNNLIKNQKILEKLVLIRKNNYMKGGLTKIFLKSRVYIGLFLLTITISFNQIQAQCTCSGNLVLNPSFETVSSGNVPANWSYWGGTFTRQTSNVVCGSYSGHFQVTSAWSGFFQDFAVAGGSILNISLYAGANNSSFTHMVQFEFYNGATLLSSINPLHIDAVLPTMQHYTFFAFAPAGTSTARIIIKSDQGIFDVDNVCITATAGSGCNYNDNTASSGFCVPTPTCNSTNAINWSQAIDLNTGAPSVVRLWDGATTSYIIPSSFYPTVLTAGTPVSVDISDVVSWDGYAGRNTVVQANERWRIVFKKNGANVFISNWTNDVPDNVTQGYWRGALNGATLPTGADQVVIEHWSLGAGQSGQGPNSVVPAGVCISVTPIGSSLSLGNFVWDDKNNNGIQEAGEPGINGATVKLYLDANNDNMADGTAIFSTTTNINGFYEFNNLSATNYIVGVVIPVGSNVVATNGGDPDNNINNDNNGIVLSNGEVRSNAITLSVAGEPTTDGDGSNGNLTLDFGFVYPCSNAVQMVTNGSFTTASVSGFNTDVPNGSYGFTSNPFQVYSVWTSLGDRTTGFGNMMWFSDDNAATNRKQWYQNYTVTSGNEYTFTTWVRNVVNNGANPTLYLTANGVQLSGSSSIITYADGWKKITGTFVATTSGNVEFAVVLAANQWNHDFVLDDVSIISCSTTNILKLGNQIFYDLNDNGIKDATESGWPFGGIIVNLHLDNNNDGITDAGWVTLSTYTDGNGFYQFEGLNPGSYFVTLTNPYPIDWQKSSVNGGDPDNDIDNDNAGVTGTTTIKGLTVTLTAGGEPTTGIDGDNTNGNQTYDFGLWKANGLGDYVFLDANANGIQDVGENGIANVLVTLSKGSTTYTRVTDANGYYFFSDLYDLANGGYSLTFATPTGYSPSPANQGNNDAKDSDPVNGVITGITVPIGTWNHTFDQTGFSSKDH